MSKCEIKVFYLGLNRNNTYISKQAAKEIGKTLRGAPIVGYYKQDKEDFTTHGEKVIIDDEGIKFQCLTIPYGFVSPDAKVWFQTFEDIDNNGNPVIHEYLMTTGYLWTEQFPESSLPVNQGRPQSMQFEKNSLQGQWKHNNKIDFFIINDAIIQKVCILGEDVEPCFQGASITAPEISSKFTLDKKFNQTLYSMMQDLKKIIEGEQQMDNVENVVVEQVTSSETSYELENNVDNNDISIEEEASASIDYAKKEDEEKEKSNSDSTEEKTDSETSSDETKEEQNENEKEEEDKKEKSSASKKYEILQKELNNLKTEYFKLYNEYQELIKFKNQIDKQQKEKLISEFYMLSDEDKKDVIKNIDKYSLDEIKAKLAVICFDKKINFSTNDVEEPSITEEGTTMTYTLENVNESSVSIPNWVKKVKENENLI